MVCRCYLLSSRRRQTICALVTGVQTCALPIYWLLDLGARPERRRRPILTVNNIYGIYRAAITGLGLAALPDFMIPSPSNLAQVLPEITGPSIQAHFVYPEALRQIGRASGRARVGPYG